MQEIFDTKDLRYDVHFATNEEIRELNKLHRGIDKVTDVLSFPMLELKSGTQKVFYNKNGELEIKIKQKKNFKLPPKDEFLGDIVINENEENVDFLKLHGLLHLLGFHHNE